MQTSKMTPKDSLVKMIVVLSIKTENQTTLVHQNDKKQANNIKLAIVSNLQLEQTRILNKFEQLHETVKQLNKKKKNMETNVLIVKLKPPMSSVTNTWYV